MDVFEYCGGDSGYYIFNNIVVYYHVGVMSMGFHIDGPLYIIHGEGMTFLPMEVLNFLNLLCNHQTLLLCFTKESLDILL
jgi:hypothetical protein